MEEVRALPKLELHAHLSGSVRQDFLLELMRRKGIDVAGSGLPFDCKQDLSGALRKCFAYFDSVAQVITDLETLRECTLHVLGLFVEENCIYLELRTAAKALDAAGASAGRTSKEDYLRTVITAIRDFQASGSTMEVRLLPSVNRGSIFSVEDARAQLKDVMDLCMRFPEECVGVDIGGDPSQLTAEAFLFPALLELRAERPDFLTRFPITFHTAEMPHSELAERENDLIIENLDHLNIRRLGHVSHLAARHRQAVFEHWRLKKSHKVGVELCPTSNMVAAELGDLRKHHFPLWYNRSEAVPDSALREVVHRASAGAPGGAGPEGAAFVSVGTDDVGLFSTTLSQEVHLLAQAFELTMEDVRELQLQAFESSFCREPHRSRLRERLVS